MKTYPAAVCAPGPRAAAPIGISPWLRRLQWSLLALLLAALSGLGVFLKAALASGLSPSDLGASASPNPTVVPPLDKSCTGESCGSCSLEVEWRSLTAERRKFGFQGFINPANLYLTNTITQTASGWSSPSLDDEFFEGGEFSACYCTTLAAGGQATFSANGAWTIWSGELCVGYRVGNGYPGGFTSGSSDSIDDTQSFSVQSGTSGLGIAQTVSGLFCGDAVLSFSFAYTPSNTACTNLRYMDDLGHEQEAPGSGPLLFTLAGPYCDLGPMNRQAPTTSSDTTRAYTNCDSWSPSSETQVLNELYDRALLRTKTLADLDALATSASGEWNTGHKVSNGQTETGTLTKTASCQFEQVGNVPDCKLTVSRVQYRFKISDSELGKDYQVKWREIKYGVPPTEHGPITIAGSDGDAYGSTEITLNPESTDGNCATTYDVEAWVDDVTDSCAAAAGPTASGVLATTKCSSCGGGSSGGGSGGTSCAGVSSLDFRISLGRVNDRESAGLLRIHESELSDARWLHPDHFQFVPGTPGAVQVANDGNNQWLKEIRAPHLLVQLTNVIYVGEYLSSYQFVFYSIVNGQTQASPFLTYTIANPDHPNSFNRMQITETRSGHALTTTYTYVAATTWQLVRGNGTAGYQQSKVFNPAQNLTTYTRTWFDPLTTEILLAVRETYTNGPWGTVLVSQVLDPDGEAATTLNTFNSQGLITQTTRPGGAWDRYVYDSQNRVVTNFSTWLDQGPTSDPDLCRMVVNDYSLTAGELTNHLPRTVTEYVLGVPVSRTFYRYHEGQTVTIRAFAPTSTAADPLNLVTTNTFYVGGILHHEPFWTRHADGTRTVHFHTLYGANGVSRVLTTYSGQADPANLTNVLVGTRTETTLDLSGHVLTNLTFAITSSADPGILTAHDWHLYDEQGRLTTSGHLDGTQTTQTYSDCCGAETVTDREGLTTTHLYDALHRVVSTTRAGVTVSNRYDALGRLLERRQLAAGFNLLTLGVDYDRLGRVLSSTNALGHATSFEYDQLEWAVRTDLILNGSPVIQSVRDLAADGSLASVSGDSSHGVRYTTGIANGFLFHQENKLNPDGTDTGEFTRTLTDFLGRTFRTEYPGGAASLTYFDSVGRPCQQVDPDGVTNLTLYSTDGQAQIRVVDLNGNGVVDWGSDRVTRSTASVANTDHGAVHRQTTEYWGEFGNTNATASVSSETSLDGLTTWSFSYGLATTNQISYPGNGWRYVTQSRPDGTRQLSTYWAGRLMSTLTTNDQLGALQSATFGYDSLGRRVTATDARNGTTTYQLDVLGRTLAVTTPAPGNGRGPQTTRYAYDPLGRVTAVTNADGAVTQSEYFMTGELRKAWGGRTYPVEYTYDYAGRMKTMTTWQHAFVAGAATNTWSYDLRGFLTSKVYQDPGNWTTYTYTPAGRLATRAWSRGVTTFYTNDNAGSLCGIGYSDPTHSVIYHFDRLGRKTNIVDATGSHLLSYDAAGHLVAETQTAGLLAGVNLTNTYDALGRRTDLSLSLEPSALSLSYAYDEASRLHSVTSGLESAEYSYLANSALVRQIDLRHNGVSAMTTTKQYDQLNRLTQVRSLGASPWPVASFDYTYNDANQRTRVTEADGSYWLYQYDSLGQVKSGKKYWSDGTPVAGQQFTYSFDDIGNRTQTQTGGDARGTGLRPAAYANNPLNQITNRQVPGTVDVLGIAHPNAAVTVNGQSPYRRGEYYDQVLSWNNSNAVVSAWVTNRAVLAGATSNRTGRVLVPPNRQPFWYDSDGNTLCDGVWTNQWDAENRLIATETTSAVPVEAMAKVTWSYRADGHWHERVVYVWTNAAWLASVTNRFIWDGNVILAILDHTNGLLFGFMRGLDLSATEQGVGGAGGLLAMTHQAEGGTSSFFVAHDGNGNVVSLVGASDGARAASYEYGPFGEALRVSGPGDLADLNPMRFSSQWTDPTTGRAKYLYREYEPSLGRWLSRDLIGEQVEPNPMAFAANAPILFLDRLGLITTRKSGGDPKWDENCSDAAEKKKIVDGLDEYCPRLDTPKVQKCLTKGACRLRPTANKPTSQDVLDAVRALCNNRQNFVVKCPVKDDLGCGDDRCGYVDPSEWQATVHLCPNYGPTRCGPLGCLLLHELTHLTDDFKEEPDNASRVEDCLWTDCPWRPRHKKK